MIQRRFQNVFIKHTEICFTLENAMGAGGGNVPIVVIGDDDRIFTEPGNKGARDRMAGGDIPNLRGGANTGHIDHAR